MNPLWILFFAQWGIILIILLVYMKEKDVAGWCGGLLTPIVLLFIILPIGGARGAFVPIVETAPIRHELVAVRDIYQYEGKIGGLIFVFGGRIDEEPYYFYYRKEGAGILLDKSNAYDVIIVEVEGDDAFILQKMKRRVKTDKWMFVDERPYEVGKEELHVPAGTVIKDFRIDME